MCRILIMTGLDEKNKELNWQFIQEMGAKMSVGNNDGLGYTAVKPNGDMFGERWHNNYDAFDYRPNKDSPRQKFLEKYKDFINLPYSYSSNKANAYNVFGEVSQEIKAITLHTRAATSGREFANTHPFVDLEQDTSLIHNGIIQNVTKEDNIRSTCDSERILNMYLKHNVNKAPDNFQSMVDELKGYFACGIVTRDASGRRVIDVFKSRARLFAAYVKDIGFVITTNKDDLTSVCKELGLEIEDDVVEVMEDKHMRLDFATAEPLFINKYRDTANQYNHTNSSAFNDFQNRRSLPSPETKPEGTQTSETIRSITERLNLEDAALDGWDYDTTTMIWTRAR